jgi:eukaryotic-like serine/threonine-protein kinase
MPGRVAAMGSDMDAHPRAPVLMDRYELGELLGRGGMGEVYVGQDRVLGRRVAIKLVAGGGGASPDTELAQRLRSEARAAASIEHPNVVRVHDLTITGTTIFVVMEYLEGEALGARLRREQQLSLDLAVRVAADVCLALAAAHQSAVIHRDIGPGNIMLCADDTVRVMDFGIALIADSAVTTGPGQTMGTPAYLSPEQAVGGTVDARADLYSLGCTLYHMVTGQPPFTGSGPTEVAWQHCHATPRPPRVLRPDLPAALEAVVLKAMAKSPEERFTDALQMRTALLAALDQGTSTMPGGPVIPAQMDPAQMRPAEVHPAPPTRTYQAGAHIDLPEVEAAYLERAAADRRRRYAGIVLIVVGLVLLTIAGAALLTGA